MKDRVLFAAAALVTALLLSTASGFAADAKAEITIAAQHAELAAGSTNLADVRMHLHHTLNCIEGPKGADFSKTELNPCQNTGDGAIPDSDNPTTTATLQTAITEATEGIAANTLKAAQDAAGKVAATLKSVQ